MWKTACFFLLVCFFLSPAFAQDMRADHIKIQEQREAALTRAEEDSRRAELEAQQSREAILKDKNALNQAIADLERETGRLKKRIAEAGKSLQQLTAEGERLQAAYADVSGVVKEAAGFVRANASDLEELFRQSPQSALIDDRRTNIKKMADASRFPSMDDVREMVDLLIEEIDLSGQVRKVPGIVVDRSGRQSPADILLLGNLTTAYRTSSEAGFALYSDASGHLFALSRNLPFSVALKIKKYMAGDSDAVYLDISGGAALRQLTHELSLVAQIPGGGPIVWPILLIFVFGAGIAAERIFYLRKRSCDAEAFMTRVTDCVRQEKWEACRSLCESQKNSKTWRTPCRKRF